jgi:hypothetical protein
MPLEQAPAAPLSKRAAGGDKRWERRRRRIWFEELLGWILVPLILVCGYWAADGILTAMGSSPAALFSNLGIVLRGH